MKDPDKKDLEVRERKKEGEERKQKSKRGRAGGRERKGQT